MTPTVKKILIGGGVLIALAAGFAVFSFSSKTDPQAVQSRGVPAAAP